MQITQTQADGLKREFKVVIAASDIAGRMDEKLRHLGGQVRIPGFRPGKAPMALLRRQYGRALLGEVVSETVSNATEKAVRDNNLQLATQPKVEVTQVEEGADLVFTMAMEVLPEVPAGDFGKLKLERLVAPVSDADVDAMVERLASEQRHYVTVPVPRPAGVGDAALVDYVGKIDGVAFDGGSAKDQLVEIGANAYVPGFTDKLVGALAGSKIEAEVAFPADYGNRRLAGKTANFSFDVKELRERKPVAVDDELAKRLGLESLAQLRDSARRHLEQDLARLSRGRLKRGLLDALAAEYSFPVPAAMVAQEFEQIWQQIHADPAAAAELGASGKSENTLRTEYQAIAERRVRLGLLLADVGRRHNIEVKPDEVNKAMVEHARRFPGQERQVIEFFRKNPEAMARLRAPIIEDKTVDFILEMAKVNEREVSREELLRDPEAPAAPPAGGA